MTAHVRFGSTDAAVGRRPWPSDKPASPRRVWAGSVPTRIYEWRVLSIWRRTGSVTVRNLGLTAWCVATGWPTKDGAQNCPCMHGSWPA